jgi:hypothetical protein
VLETRQGQAVLSAYKVTLPQKQGRPMDERAMNRVQRMARLVPAGALILDFMQSAQGRRPLAEAAARGIPPIAAVSKLLIDLVGADALKPTLVKQFCGLAARAVLAQEGFVPIQSGIRIRNDPVFSTGAVYAKRLVSRADKDDQLLKRILDGLSEEEMRWADSYLQQRLRELKDAPDPPKGNPGDNKRTNHGRRPATERGKRRQR